MTDKKPYNAASPKQVAQRATRERLAQEQRETEFVKLLEQPEFRRFLWHHICVRCRLFQSPYNPNGSAQTHDIGRQDVGRELFVDVESVDPKLITTMMLGHAQGRE